jgi:hypothetical protein
MTMCSAQGRSTQVDLLISQLGSSLHLQRCFDHESPIKPAGAFDSRNCSWLKALVCLSTPRFKPLPRWRDNDDSGRRAYRSTYRSTAAKSSAISPLFNGRLRPGRKSPRRIGPTAVLINRWTGWSTAASNRRTTWLRPSCRTTSTITRAPERPTTRNESTWTRPSSSSTPVRNSWPRSRGIAPTTSAR